MTDTAQKSSAATTADAERTEIAAATREISGLISEWVELRRRMLRTPGVQYAVRVGGELIASGALGLANADEGTPLREDHLFRIASHSKTFAATAVMILRDRGLLRLDDTVATHVPALADTPLADRTVRELIGHQGGVIRDGDDCDYWQLMRDFPDAATLLEDLHRDGVSFGANEYFKYSNYGYSVVGQIIESVSGRSFRDFVAEAITGPLGLPRLTADLSTGADGSHPDLAAGHSLLLDGDDELFALRNPSTGSMAAATGFVACANDLSAYASAHVTGDERLLADSSKRLMQRTESIVSADDEEIGRYALGLELHTIGKHSFVGHSGGFPGFVTRTFVDPKSSLVVSVLTNASRGPAHQLAVGIVKLIDLAVKTRARGADDEVDPSIDLDSFATTVVAGFGRTTIARMGARLLLLHPEQDDPTVEASELTVRGPDRLEIARRPGYGSAGEPVIYQRTDGAIEVVRLGGMSSWPETAFRARRRQQMARSERAGTPPPADLHPRES